MKSTRFSSFYSKVDDIHTSVQQMINCPSLEMAFRIHISDGLYVSMYHHFNYVSIRHFFVPEGQQEIKATKFGVSLWPQVWEIPYNNIEEIWNATKTQKEAEMCFLAVSHQNQE